MEGAILRYLVAAASLLLAFHVDALAQDVTFARDDYASFAGARAIVSADFNRDGLPDVAVANSGRNSVTILLNQRDAGLARVADVAVGAGPFAMTAGDFNRDGIPDLAVANADGNSISVLLGRGDASFIRNDIAAASQNPRGITAADLNHDGKLDLIYSAYATGAVQVLIGNGAGTFTKGVAYISSALHPQGLATADFNHDGHLDVAGMRARSSHVEVAAGAGSRDAVLADFDVNGRLDIASANEYAASATVLSNHTFFAPAAFAFRRVALTGAPTSHTTPRGAWPADFNRDGRPDLVTGSGDDDTLTVLLTIRRPFRLRRRALPSRRRLHARRSARHHRRIVGEWDHGAGQYA